MAGNQPVLARPVPKRCAHVRKKFRSGITDPGYKLASGQKSSGWATGEKLNR